MPYRWSRCGVHRRPDSPETRYGTRLLASYCVRLCQLPPVFRLRLAVLMPPEAAPAFEVIIERSLRSASPTDAVRVADHPQPASSNSLSTRSARSSANGIIAACACSRGDFCPVNFRFRLGLREALGLGLGLGLHDRFRLWLFRLWLSGSGSGFDGRRWRWQRFFLEQQLRDSWRGISSNVVRVGLRRQG